MMSVRDKPHLYVFTQCVTETNIKCVDGLPMPNCGNMSVIMYLVVLKIENIISLKSLYVLHLAMTKHIVVFYV